MSKMKDGTCTYPYSKDPTFCQSGYCAKGYLI